MFMPSFPILICSLAYLSIAETVEKHAVPNCETLYDCFAPTKCDLDTVTLTDSKIITVDATRTVYDNCPAIFRFHAYATNWVHVSILSFDANIKSIEIIQKATSDTTQVTFSCKENAEGKFEGKYNDALQKIIDPDEPNPLAKLQCTFVVKLKKKQTVFIDSTNPIPKTEIKVGAESTKPTQLTLSALLRCNPLLFKFNKEMISRDKKYEKIVFAPNKYYCKHSNTYKLEYRPEDSSNHEPVTEITCVNGAFHFDSKEMSNEDSIDIRCAADARYFCDYSPKSIAGKIGPKLTSPDTKIMQKSELKCPQNHYLAHGRKRILNANFECQNYGGLAMWTLNETRFSESGPEVYCTDELDCNLLNKIPDSSVKKGELDHEGLPKCFPSGELHVDGKKIENRRCDFKTGKFKYSFVGETERDVVETTEFECIYAPIENEKRNEEIDTILVAVGAVGIALSALMIGVVLFLVIFCGRKRISRMRSKRIKEANERLLRDETNFKTYCYTKDEKRAMKQNGGENEEEEEGEGAAAGACMDLTVWSGLIMHFLATSLNFSSISATRITHEPVAFNADVAQKEAARNLEIASEMKITINEPRDLKPLEKACFHFGSKFTNGRDRGKLNQ